MEINNKEAPQFHISIVIVVVILVIIFVFFALKNSKEAGNDDSVKSENSENVSELKDEVRLNPILEVTEKESSGDVAEKKEEILAKVRSSTPLTDKDREEITLIMFGKAQFYGFTKEESDEIFEALKDQVI